MNPAAALRNSTYIAAILFWVAAWVVTRELDIFARQPEL